MQSADSLRHQPSQTPTTLDPDANIPARCQLQNETSEKKKIFVWLKTFGCRISSLASEAVSVC